MVFGPGRGQWRQDQGDRPAVLLHPALRQDMGEGEGVGCNADPRCLMLWSA